MHVSYISGIRQFCFYNPITLSYKWGLIINLFCFVNYPLWGIVYFQLVPNTASILCLSRTTLNLQGRSIKYWWTCSSGGIITGSLFGKHIKVEVSLKVLFWGEPKLKHFCNFNDSILYYGYETFLFFPYLIDICIFKTNNKVIFELPFVVSFA